MRLPHKCDEVHQTFTSQYQIGLTDSKFSIGQDSPPKHLCHIFERFLQARQASDNVGDLRPYLVLTRKLRPSAKLRTVMMTLKVITSVCPMLPLFSNIFRMAINKPTITVVMSRRGACSLNSLRLCSPGSNSLAHDDSEVTFH